MLKIFTKVKFAQFLSRTILTYVMIRKDYIAPTIKRQLHLCLETDLLVGSVVDKVEKIESTGQQVETKDFSDHTSFNFNWDTN